MGAEGANCSREAIRRERRGQNPAQVVSGRVPPYLPVRRAHVCPLEGLCPVQHKRGPDMPLFSLYNLKICPVVDLTGRLLSLKPVLQSAF